MLQAIKGWIFRHTGAKIASLLLALALWFYVNVGETTKRVFLVPLVLKNIPADLELAPGSLSMLSVTVRGPRSIILNLAAEDFSIPIDLSGRLAGRYAYLLSPDKVRAPWGVEILQVLPAEISISLKRAKRVE